MKRLAGIFVIGLFFSSFTLADDYVVICNKNMEDLSISQVKAIFLKKLTFVNDIEVVPINLDARDPLRLKFEQEVLHLSFQRLKIYWTKEHYMGHRPPVSMKSQESIKAFVKNVDGAIGYIDAKNFDDDLKVIYKWSE